MIVSRFLKSRWGGKARKVDHSRKKRKSSQSLERQGCYYLPLWGLKSAEKEEKTRRLGPFGRPSKNSDLGAKPKRNGGASDFIHYRAEGGGSQKGKAHRALFFREIKIRLGESKNTNETLFGSFVARRKKEKVQRHCYSDGKDRLRRRSRSQT